jgi:hypothetical protein
VRRKRRRSSGRGSCVADADEHCQMRERDRRRNSTSCRSAVRRNRRRKGRRKRKRASEISKRTRFHYPYPYFKTGFWVRGGSRAFARISSRTLGRYVAVINPAPLRCRSNGFQRISGALQTTPEEPRQRNGPLGAPKRRPDPPQPAPHPSRLVCGGNHGAGTYWCPSGGAPRWRRPGRRRPKPRQPGSRFRLCGNAQGPSLPIPPGAHKAQPHRPP